MTRWQRRLKLAGVVLAGLGLATAAAGARRCAAAELGWQPTQDMRLDIQLTAPYDYARAVDILVLEPFNTSLERVQQLHNRGVVVVCYLSAGLWESWRPDAPRFPKAALGRSPSGWPGQRWLDPRRPDVRELIEHRLDRCRSRGFAGVLLGGLDGHTQQTGFMVTPDEQLDFNRRLAEAAHARGLTVGILNDLAQAEKLAGTFDFLVADRCVAGADCNAISPYKTAHKPVYLVAYTNQTTRMATYCRLAAEVGAILILKTQSLNGKLHRRCG